MVKHGYRVVITHGNGPQVGNILIQNTHSQDLVPAMPLDVCGAKSQGLIGYMIQQALHNELVKEDINVPVATVLTQVIVDENDPAFKNPTKPIGPFYTEDEARRFEKERGEKWVEDSGRGWRKVVPSPLPVEIFEIRNRSPHQTRHRSDCCRWRRGIRYSERQYATRNRSCYRQGSGKLQLAGRYQSRYLMILTDVERVAINYRTPAETYLTEITVDEAKSMEEGHFSAGSMGPKVQAAIDFASGGGTSIIASLKRSLDALRGTSGTRIKL